MAKREIDKAEKVRRFLVGEVMKANPAFDPAIVREVVDEKTAAAADEKTAAGHGAAD